MDVLGEGAGDIAVDNAWDTRVDKIGTFGGTEARSSFRALHGWQKTRGWLPSIGSLYVAAAKTGTFGGQKLSLHSVCCMVCKQPGGRPLLSVHYILVLHFQCGCLVCLEEKSHLWIHRLYSFVF